LATCPPGEAFRHGIPGGDRIEAQVELVLASEFESCFRKSIVRVLRAWMALGEVGGVLAIL
jgi:hypothetical protein